MFNTTRFCVTGQQIDDQAAERHAAWCDQFARDVALALGGAAAGVRAQDVYDVQLRDVSVPPVASSSLRRRLRRDGGRALAAVLRRVDLGRAPGRQKNANGGPGFRIHFPKETK